MTYFAAVMLMVSGILDICRGIMGLHRDAVFVTTPKYVFQFDTVSWGWIHLILGACAVVVAFGLLKAALWARIIGVTLAGLLILANFLSIPYYPLWSVVVMALSAFVIWGLCTVRRGF
ncbi:hypothetical protein K6I34_006498 [Streptomyces sp. UNOC14_S4]|nr:hypothetical protein [Streptomyces sp. UNOC14_S4]